MRYHDSKIQCELTLSPRVNVMSAWCLGIIGLHIYEREKREREFCRIDELVIGLTKSPTALHVCVMSVVTPNTILTSCAVGLYFARSPSPMYVTTYSIYCGL